MERKDYMAEPKKKLSASRSGKRRSHLALKQINLNICPKCKQNKLPHRVCENCGYYKQEIVIAKSTKKKS